MSSQAKSIRDAIKALIDAAEIAGVTVVTAWVFSHDLSAVPAEGYLVTISPASRDIGLFDRSSSEDEPGCLIVVQHRVAIADGGILDDEDLDAAMLVAERVANLFDENADEPLADVGARWSGTRQFPLVDERHLKELSLFTSYINVTYTVERE